MHLLIALLVLPDFAMAECLLSKAQEEFQGVVGAPGPRPVCWLHSDNL